MSEEDFDKIEKTRMELVDKIFTAIRSRDMPIGFINSLSFGLMHALYHCNIAQIKEVEETIFEDNK